MRAPVLLLSLVLCLNALPRVQVAIAQDGEEFIDAPTSRITFVVNGAIQAPEDAAYALPLSMLERLERQPALSQLHLRGSDARPYETSGKFEAWFLFDDMAAFRAWYEDEATQALLNELKERSGRSLLDFTMHIQRPGSGSSLEDTVGPGRDVEFPDEP